MNREFLRGLGIAEDVIPQVINQHHDELRPIKEKADKSDEFKQQAETALEELKTRDTQLEELQAKAKGNEELNAELEKYKEINAKQSEEFNKSQLQNAIKLEAMKQNVVDPDAFLKLVNADSVKRNEDGSFEGIAELIEASKETYPYMYEASKPTGKPLPLGGSTPTAMTKEQIMAIPNDAERQAAIRENMNLFQ